MVWNVVEEDVVFLSALREILFRVINDFIRAEGAHQVEVARTAHAGDVRASFGEPDQIRAGAAPDVEHALSAVAIEVDEPREVVQLLEVVLIEFGEELFRAWNAGTDIKIVDMTVPVVSDGGVIGHWMGGSRTA